MVATTALGWHGLVLSFIIAMLVMMGAGRGHTTIAALWGQGAKPNKQTKRLSGGDRTPSRARGASRPQPDCSHGGRACDYGRHFSARGGNDRHGWSLEEAAPWQAETVKDRRKLRAEWQKKYPWVRWNYKTRKRLSAPSVVTPKTKSALPTTRITPASKALQTMQTTAGGKPPPAW